MWFTNAEDLVGITRPQDIKYVKIIKAFINVVGGWPYKEIEGHDSKLNVYKRYYLVILTCSLLVGQLIYISKYFGKHTFLVLGHSYITVLMTIVAIFRYMLPLFRSYHKTVAEFFGSIHLFNHKHKSEIHMEMHILVHKISHFFTMFLCTMVVIGPFLFNLAPIYNNFRSGAFSRNRPKNVTLQLSLYYWLPFDCTTDIKGYTVILIFNMYVTNLCTNSFLIIDLLLSVMVFHIWGHLKILTKTLDMFPPPGFMSNSLEGNSQKHLMFSEEELKVIHGKLRDIISQHQLITNFTSLMSETFGCTLLIYYTFHQVCGCLLLLEVTQSVSAALAGYGPLTMVLFEQLIQISFIFELLGSVNDGLADAVYCLPWESMDSANRKIVFTILRQSQKSMNLKAMDMLTIGVQTMASILKRTMSYYLMLQTIEKNER